ncbi:hypothetical protein LUZ63_019779 [Rhynchospora breviuscula]|uniref:1-acylglycerol-3-phosphate O-acyltransferase n=1 Tax=Rhynchospora breviuscula TaxID=2022672 RepID=A0A9Q0C6X9_9POAL|nr:hypothetical protein LUZ63_019779 [Rhynchospora breviuscula]
MKLPVFGWAFHVMEFVPVERKWEIDEEIMRSRLEKFKDPRDPLWLAFPLKALITLSDVTIAYKHQLPVFLDNIFGTDPAEVYVHTECMKLDEIPSMEDESYDWLVERFRLKDELLANFMTTGHFPNEGMEGD